MVSIDLNESRNLKLEEMTSLITRLNIKFINRVI